MIRHAVIFSPLGQATRVEQVIARLSHAIITGLLEANEQLPNEAELAKLMGVSHITIREALNTLRSQSLIYTTRGRHGGSFINKISSEQRVKQHPLHQLSSDYLSDLGEFHAAIVLRSTKLALQRTTVKELTKLKHCIDVFAEASTAEFRAQSDMRCLLTIVANAQSARLANQALMLQSEWAPLIAVLYQKDEIHTAMSTLYLEFFEQFSQKNTQAIHCIEQIFMHLTDELLNQKFKLKTL
ncbi:GntR family transcriptional regulator [Acinetobacter apis]|uniref:Transcriptional regulator, GntR family n=1 Tax=Acinetobacter apis TaxID=1229165 RepID=A0A217EHH0_9GAMM|nr:GntR family transcriptional regulator [Acinetobacter apis]SNQ29626.1 transcriptional regulator, GntR family [Acinetobacter apis]